MVFARATSKHSTTTSNWIRHGAAFSKRRSKREGSKGKEEREGKRKGVNLFPRVQLTLRLHTVVFSPYSIRVHGSRLLTWSRSPEVSCSFSRLSPS